MNDLQSPLVTSGKALLSSCRFLQQERVGEKQPKRLLPTPAPECSKEKNLAFLEQKISQNGTDIKVLSAMSRSNSPFIEM